MKSDFPALKKKCMFCYCNEICKFMSEGRCTSVPLYHTGQEVTYNALVSAFSAAELTKRNTNSHYNVYRSIIQPYL